MGRRNQTWGPPASSLPTTNGPLWSTLRRWPSVSPPTPGRSWRSGSRSSAPSWERWGSLIPKATFTPRFHLRANHPSQPHQGGTPCHPYHNPLSLLRRKTTILPAMAVEGTTCKPQDHLFCLKSLVCRKATSNFSTKEAGLKRKISNLLAYMGVFDLVKTRVFA